MNRCYSLQEANQALPLVRSIVAEWQERRAERQPDDVGHADPWRQPAG